MGRDGEKLLLSVADYYSAKLAEHGETARGVDWNGEVSQMVRFEQLCRLIGEGSAPFSINDLGCGYGALVAHLRSAYVAFDYRGFDVSAAMIHAANAKHSGSECVSFVETAVPDRIADYGVASGIFNVRLDACIHAWQSHVERTLDSLNATSSKGFSFNCLTSYSDADRMQDYLYYADPLVWFDLCKRKYSRQVALLHDYGLYEFTVLVRKEGV